MRAFNCLTCKRNGYIPVAFQSATLLAALAHPDHLLLVGSWGFACLPPSSNLKSFGYKHNVLITR
ncbi:MAG: hypothetical protein QS721_01725 [Candidatus Endonucleobacter sp. (ex Gigantidas childressi)]|nr:hypothetical protein [Candidatus Endonucleobacter sp. (ex Gigantidas childressi)]